MLLIDDKQGTEGGVSNKSGAPDVVTYSPYVHGSIFSIPNWKANAFLFSNDYDSLSMSIYGFLKSFLGSVDIHSPVSENLMAPLVLMPIKSCATHPRSIEEKLRHILHVEKYGNLRKNEEEHHEQLLLTKSILSLPKQREQQQQHTREQRVYCPSSSRGSSQHNANSTNNALLTLLRLSLKQQQIASGTNQGAIDNRIEQAMDLVKSHLMNAVRSEVEELKERIVKLEDVISHLQTENDFLKANVTQEVLTQLPPPTAHHQILQQQGPNAPVSAAPAGSISPIASPLILSSQQQQPL